MNSESQGVSKGSAAPQRENDRYSADPKYSNANLFGMRLAGENNADIAKQNS